MFARVSRLNRYNLHSSKPSQQFSGYSTQTIRPPYTNQFDFEAATNGSFHAIRNKEGSELIKLETIKKESWIIYSTTLNSNCMQPAITYTGADIEFLNKLNNFPLLKAANKEECHAQGRLYLPTEHTWALNATWLLAQAHKLRDIVALSDAAYTISAFTKEMVCAFRTGYKLHHISFLSDGHTLAYLTPPEKEFALKITLADFLHITPKDCQEAQLKFNQEKFKLIQGYHHESEAKVFKCFIGLHDLNKSLGILPSTRLPILTPLHGNAHRFFKKEHTHLQLSATQEIARRFKLQN